MIHSSRKFSGMRHTMARPQKIKVLHCLLLDHIYSLLSNRHLIMPQITPIVTRQCVYMYKPLRLDKREREREIGFLLFVELSCQFLEKTKFKHIMFSISSCTTCIYVNFIVDIKLLAKNQSNESTETQVQLKIKCGIIMQYKQGH